MKVSLCVICKNEEKKIGRCINSAKKIVDEIIVVDTGSEDRTIEIAKQLEATVFQIPWEKDFAKAKNFAIEKAMGDWIIFLDADEYFTGETVGNVRRLIKDATKRKKDCIYSEIINVNGGEVTSIIKTNRIFKNDKQIRYKGRIHERLYKINGNLMGVDFLEQIRILHDGYSEETWNEKNKGERNIELLLEELKEKPYSSDINYYLMQSYSSMGKLYEAWEYANKALEYNKFELVGVKVAIYDTLLSLCSALEKDEVVTDNIYRAALKESGKYPDFDFRYGRYLYRNKRYSESVTYFNSCLNKVATYEEIEESVVKGNIILVFELLANAYLIQGQYNQAIPVLVKILRINPYRVKELYNLINILQTTETGVAIGNVLGRLYDYTKVKDQVLLLKISKEAKNQELYEYILKYVDERIREQVEA